MLRIEVFVKLFHGSNEVIEFPKILTPHTPLDFGSGFYTTSEYAQANRWMRLASRNHHTGFINIFEFNKDDALSLSLALKEFQSPDDEWIEFITRNHTDAYYDHGFDIVSGPLPDEDSYLALTSFEAGSMHLDKLKELLSRRDLSTQCLFHTERALRLLHFIGYRRIRISLEDDVKERPGMILRPLI